jgi:outer membrane protein OmpA-like peptidoglycan-associated protein
MGQLMTIVTNLRACRRGVTALLIGLSSLVCAAAVAPVASAAGPFPITESFTHTTTSAGWVLGNAAILTAPSIDADGSGWLRLTPATGAAFGYAVNDISFPSTDGVLVQFDYATWGGSGADGLAFFLYDGSTPIGSFHAGAAGGSLGYTSCGATPGLTNAYIGVGFDEFGNFTNLGAPGGCGLDGATPHPNYVSVRGSQSDSYHLLTGASVATTESLSATRAFARHVTISVTPDSRLSVYITYPDGTFQTIAEGLQLPAAPATLKLGFAASTGGSTNNHEIGNTQVVKPVDFTTTVSDGATGHTRTANTWTAVVTNHGPNPTTGETVLATTGLQSLTNVSWTCVGSTAPLAACTTASGTGLPNLTAGAMASGSTLTYAITGTPAAGTDFAQLGFESQPIGDTGDLNPSDNAAVDTTTLTPVFDSVPTFTLSSAGTATAALGTFRGGSIVTTRQWQRCDADGTNCAGITGATNPTYATSVSDRGHSIRFTQTATNSAGATTSNSLPYLAFPETTLATGPSGVVSSSSAAFSFSFTGTAGTVFECQLDGGAWATCTSPRSYTTLGEGAHTFGARAVYGGLSDPTPSLRTWTVDTISPGTTLTGTPPAPSNSPSATFAFTGAGTGSGIDHLECRLDGGSWATCTSPATVTGLADGAHTYDVRAFDLGGNVDPTPASVTWTIDTVAPDTLITGGPALSSNGPGAVFAFGGSDAATGVSGFECRLDGGAWAPCRSPFALSTLADGTHTLEVRSFDLAGNADPTPGSYTWTVDTVSPAPATFTTSPAARTRGTDAHFALAGETGATIICSVDGAAAIDCTAGLDLSGLARGEHSISIVQTDAAGNSSDAASYTWRVTAVPLQVKAAQLETELVKTTSAPGDNGLAVTCALDRGATTGCTVKLYALHNGKRVLIGTGRASGPGKQVHAVLNAVGRTLLGNAVGGLKVSVQVSATAAGLPAMTSHLTTRLYAGRSFTVPVISFDSNSAIITADARSLLAGVAPKLHAARGVLCIGYTDGDGASAFNVALGLERANATCAALHALGVDARISVRTSGKAGPRATNATSEGRTLNRRVELHISY